MAYNSEKLRLISFNGFKLLDSMQFVTAGLGSIVEDMRESDHSFDLLRSTGLVDTEEKYGLLIRKGKK
jgi:hypothetical protein